MMREIEYQVVACMYVICWVDRFQAVQVQTDFQQILHKKNKLLSDKQSNR